jgi:hypothetical protein
MMQIASEQLKQYKKQLNIECTRRNSQMKKQAAFSSSQIRRSS